MSNSFPAGKEKQEGQEYTRFPEPAGLLPYFICRMLFAIKIIIAGWHIPIAIGMPDKLYGSFHDDFFLPEKIYSWFLSQCWPNKVIISLSSSAAY